MSKYTEVKDKAKPYYTPLQLHTIAKYVYTYLPKMNTALSLGILSTAKSPSGWLKYKLRSGKTTKLLVLLYLNSLLPNRAYAFSAFSSPIPEDAHKDFLLFKKSKLLYAVAIAKLLRDKRILSMYRTSDKGKDTSKVSLILEIDWSNRKPGKFLFSKVPHYIIAVKDGVVPKEYIKKLASLKFMDFPLNEVLLLKARIAKNYPIYTTRVSNDLKFKKGDIVKTPLSDKTMSVTNLRVFKKLKLHPYYLYLTELQKLKLKKYKVFKVLLLLLSDIALNPIYHQTAGVGKNRVRISDLVRYIKLNKLKPSTLRLTNIKTLDHKIDDIWGNGKFKLAKLLTAKLLANNHLPRILNADTKYPIIYNIDNGTTLDGVHRVLKSILEGRNSIKAYKLRNKDILKLQGT